MKINNQGFSSFYVFLGGVAAGAIVALLYAPGSGYETRERLIGAVRRGKRRAWSVTPALRAALEEAGVSARAAFEDRYRHYLAALEAEEAEQAATQGDVAA